MTITKKSSTTLRRFAVGASALALAAWVGADAAWADREGRTTSSQASSRTPSTSSTSKSSSGGTRATARTSDSRSHSSSRRAVPRSSSSGGRQVTRHAPRGSVSIGFGGYRGHRNVGYGLGWGWGYGFGYGYPYYYGYYGFPYFWGPHYGYDDPYRHYPWGYGAPRDAARAPGALDLNVKPKRAEVWVDGYYAGPAAKLDGFPGYLWLEKGPHEVVFFYDGYETVTRQVVVLPGRVVDIRLRLEEGPSTPPQQAMTRRATPRIEVTGAPGSGPRPEPARAAEATAEPRKLDLRGEPGRFTLVVEPSDASIYLDGRFLGTAGELAGLHDSLVVDAGDHLLEVARPGFETEEVEFTVEPGEEVEVEVDLQPS